MLTGNVTITIPGLKSCKQAVQGNSELCKKVMKKWEARYRGFALKRFDVFSKGGGNWAPLAPATIRRRRAGSSTILRDKNLLFNALNPAFQNAPGSFSEIGDWIVITGYGGESRYTGKGSNVSIADIAEFHDKGDGVPQRKIIETPDAGTVAAMARDAENDINKDFANKTTR